MCVGSQREVESIQFLLTLRLDSMSCVATVYASHFPSGEICGAETRCILIISSKVMGCFAASCALLANPQANVKAPARALRSKRPFIWFLLKLPGEDACKTLDDVTFPGRIQ